MKYDESVAKAVQSYFEKKGLPLHIALTFSDVVVKDLFSDIDSRSDSALKKLHTQLARGVHLNAPIVSANMDTVTDSRMAIALARLGGMGFIHQFFSFEERVKQVKKVKRADNERVDEPLTISPEVTLAEAKRAMAQVSVSSAMVVDAEHKLVGILAARDYRYKTDDSLLVSALMKKSGLVTALPNVTRAEVERLLDQSRFEKLPLVDEDGFLRGLITGSDFLKQRQFPNAARDEKGKLRVGAAISLSGHYLNEVEGLIRAGSDVILLDTARANSKRVQEATRKIKEAFPNAPLVVGNIDTPEAAKMLIDAGADCLKVGIGPGSACKTRPTTGIGIPQVTAVASVAAIAASHGIPVIADGGIRSGGDLAKALVAGANLVMMGGMLAGTDESPGEVFQDGGKRYKHFRGSASYEFQSDRVGSGNLSETRASEGVPRRVLYTGPLKSIVDELLGHLRSDMSYVGARSISELQKKGTFVRQTPSGNSEGLPQE